MAITEGTLLGAAAFACGLGYLGLFKQFSGDDRWTRVLLLFGSSITWGVVGLSSYDVIVFEASATDPTRSIPMYVYLGFGLAFIVALFAFNELLQAIGRDASDASDGLLS